MSVQLEANARESMGKGSSRALRRQGLLPAVVYGENEKNIHISLDPRPIVKELYQPGFFAKVFDLKVGGKKMRVIPRDIQLHPITDNPIHLDLMRVGKDSKITVSIPVAFINEDKCPALKQGGTLNIVVHNLEVSSSVDSIPENITIDLEGLGFGHTVHLADLSLPKNVTALHPERDNTIATIVAPATADEAGKA